MSNVTDSPLVRTDNPLVLAHGHGPRQCNRIADTVRALTGLTTATSSRPTRTNRVRAP